MQQAQEKSKTEASVQPGPFCGIVGGESSLHCFGVVRPRKTVLSLRVAVFSGLVLLTTSATTFGIPIGARIQLGASGAKVRASAGSASIVGTNNASTYGTVLAGPTPARISGSSDTTIYQWYQINYDGSAYDGWSAEVGFTQPIPGKAVPESPGYEGPPGPGEVLSSRTVMFRWSALSTHDAKVTTSYSLNVRDLDVAPPNDLKNYETTDTFREVQLTYGHHYRWNVIPQNKDLYNGSGLPTLYFWIAPRPSIVRPGSTTSPGLILPDLVPTMEWTAVPGAQGYRIYISRSPYGEANTFFSQQVSSSPWQIPANLALPTDTLCRWKLTALFDDAIQSNVESEPSDPLYFQTPADRDTVKPSITRFEPSDTQLHEGDSVTLRFTVSDAGGSGLKRVLLFRNDYSDGEFDTRWQIIDQMNVSGAGPIADSFVDSPPLGDHWYGLHVLDNEDNEIDERAAQLGPDKVTVTVSPRRFAVSVSTEPEAAGTITLVPVPEADGKYTEGTSVQVEGVSRSGYSFLLWTRDASGTRNPFQFTVSRDTSITALFERTDTHPPFSILPIATANAATFSSTVQTRSRWSYIVEFTRDLKRWFKLVLLRGDDDVKTFVDPDTSMDVHREYRVGTIPDTESGLKLKLPLPGGKSWLLTTEIGDSGCSASDPVKPSHTGINHYSIDLDNWSKFGDNPGVAETDVPVLAAAGGVVVRVAYDPTPLGNGHFLVIDHDYDGDENTGYSTRYLHLKEIPLVIENQTVTTGQPIGIMGGTVGFGVHLHFGVRYRNDGGLTLEAREALQKVRLEELTLDQYKVECDGLARLKYYPSTNQR